MLPILKLDKAAFGSGGTVTSVIVQPSTSPSDEATGALLDVIRTQTAPKVLAESGTKIYVGGTQAVSEDFTTRLAAALPVFLLLVVGLGFIALMLLFQPLLIPLTAALTSLLSFAGALDVTVGSGRFVSAAAAIMTSAFLSFVPTHLMPSSCSGWC
ncbi:MAG: hypothetical protein EXQ60_07455 [Candidatus Nanopelagicales bacterium]|nr:hypothetical protein [Candidatus Nanopelagicales bacterium]